VVVVVELGVVLIVVVVVVVLVVLVVVVVLVDTVVVPVQGFTSAEKSKRHGSTTCCD
jgi:hypothetical protein